MDEAACGPVDVVDVVDEVDEVDGCLLGGILGSSLLGFKRLSAMHQVAAKHSHFQRFWPWLC